MMRIRSADGTVLGVGGVGLLALGLLVPAVATIHFPDGGPTFAAGHAARFCTTSLGAFASGVSPATARVCAQAAALSTWSGVAVAAGVVVLALAAWRFWVAARQGAGRAPEDVRKESAR